MISAQELRIGNKIFRRGYIVTVDPQTIYDIAYFPDTIGKEYSPIQLSPDILERAGFKINNAGNYDNRMELAFKDGSYHFRQGWTDVELKSFHQLQNLFFCLCGKELEIQNI